MRLTKLGALSILTSLTLLAGPAGFASLAMAAPGGPSVVLSSTTATSTNATSIPVSATFSGPVSGFTSSGITVTNGTVNSFAGSGASYTFNVAPTSQGTVTVAIPADVASSTTTNLGNTASANTLTFTSDTSPPVVSNQSVSTSTSSATITWNTNEGATGQVNYGTTTSYTASSTLVSTYDTTHTATLAPLSPSTVYHYQIRSVDAAGNVGTTSDATFTTATAPVPGPVITNITVTGIGSTTATVNWNTDVPASSQVSYGTTTSYGQNSAFNGTASTTHTTTLTNLNEGTLYHFAVMSGSTSTTTSADQTFVTQSTASSTPLAVVSITPVLTNAKADGTFANGLSWVMRLTVPDNEDAFRMKFADWMASTGTFATANDVRISSPQSSNASTPATGFISANNNYGNWLYLIGDAASSTPGRQIDVTIEVRVPVGTPAGSYSTTFGAQSVMQSATSTTP